MQTIKDFLAKYSITTHSLAAAFATVSAAFAAVQPFHDLVMSVYDVTPSVVRKLIVTGIALYAWYRSGKATSV